MAESDGWSGLFSMAFERSRNAMILTDEQRRIQSANGAFVALLGRRRPAVIGRRVYELVDEGPLLSEEDWSAALRAGRFTGDAMLVKDDGATVAVQWAASTEVVTGRRLVLFVALATSRWGGRFRRSAAAGSAPQTLTVREREIVQLVSLGGAGPEIADELQISHETVRTHVRNAMEKLDARSRAHLVAKALAEGHILVEPGRI
jgi:PAS domain S-box-containing protein